MYIIQQTQTKPQYISGFFWSNFVPQTFELIHRPKFNFKTIQTFTGIVLYPTTTKFTNKRQGFKSSHVATQKRTRAEKS